MIHTVAGNGSRGFSGDGGLATKAQLDRPEGIAVSESGEIYIADTFNYRIRKIAPNGFISTIAGNGSRGFSGDGGLAINARLDTPWRVAVSSNGEVYIADTGNYRIRKVALDGLISTIAGNGKEGFSGDGGLATNAQLCGPCGITTGPGGEIFIADRDNHRIRKVTPNGLISTVAGNGKKGLSGDGGLATNARLNYPEAIAISESGEIYIADKGNHTIRKISKNGFISTIAGNGEKGFSGDGGPATDAQLYHPQGIAVSESGQIYIADGKNHRIRKVAPNGLISTIAGNGETGFGGDGGLAIHTQLPYPEGVVVSSSGEIYIADTVNRRIRRIDGLCPSGMVRGTSLKKYERDHASNGLVCFRPLLAKLAPTFCEAILGTDNLLNASEKQIVQQLIDSFMYGTELELDDLESATVVDWLFVLGMSEDSEFFGVKMSLLTKFMDALTEDSIPVVLKRLDALKERNTTENGLLSQMMDYTLGRAALILRNSPTLCTNRIIQKHSVQILLKMYQTEVAPILLSETDKEETGSISSLFNDPAMNDVKILLGEKEWYCHCTILSSYSPYFEALFNSGHAFNDLENDIYRIDCTEFGEELHEMVIKFCYNLLDESSISESVAIPLLKCASFYGVTRLVDHSVAAIEINAENYFELVEQLGDCPCEILCAKLVEFGFANLKPLGMTEEKLASLPEQIKEKLSWKCMQEQVRK